MEPVAVVVDPEFILRQLEQEDDPLGRIARGSPGVSLDFYRSRSLEERLVELNAPVTVIGYYRSMTREVGSSGSELDPGDYPDRLSFMLAEAAQAVGASFALTDNQELTHLPYPGGRIVDEWDLADALATGGPDEPLEDTETESVFKCGDEIQCSLLTSLLEEESIPFLIKSQEVTSLDGILATGAGFWAEIHVFTGDADRARRLIEDFLSAETGDR